MENLKELLGVLLLILCTLAALGVFVYAGILVDSVFTKIWFFKGVRQNTIVVLTTIGGNVVKYLARVTGRNYNPKTGKSVAGRQQYFYSSQISNHFANFWGIYYKGVNTRLFKPAWCDDHQIPFAEPIRITTEEVEVSGISFSIDTLVTLEKHEIDKYLYLGEEKNPFKLSEGDYSSQLRTFAHKRGKIGGKIKEEGLDFRSIFGIETEDLSNDNDFKTGPYQKLLDSAKQYGLHVANISIDKIYPTDPEDRKLLTEEARAEINKRIKVKDAEGDAKKRIILADANAKAITQEGDATIGVEEKLIEKGVSASYRRAMAFEKMPGLAYLADGGSQPPPVVLDNSRDQKEKASREDKRKAS